LALTRPRRHGLGNTASATGIGKTVSATGYRQQGIGNTASADPGIGGTAPAANRGVRVDTPSASAWP